MVRANPIRVMVLTDSPQRRASVQAAIEASPAFEWTMRAAGSRMLAEDVEAAVPDVLVVDTEPDANEVLRFAQEAEHPAPAIVLLTDEADSDRIQQALRSDGAAILSRDATAVEIAAAIEAAAAGLFVVSPDILGKLLANPASSQSPASTAPIEALTPREIEVLAMLAEGLGNKEIARQLAISDNTVKFHLSAVFGKLGAASRTEAVLLGMRHGLIMV